MARGFGAFWLVLLGAVIGLLLDGFLNGDGVIMIAIAIAAATWVIVAWQTSNKEELEAEISLLKDKLDKLEEKDKEK